MFLPFLLLLIAFLVLWLPRFVSYWPYLFGGSLVAAYGTGMADAVALIAIAAYAGACYGLKQSYQRSQVIYWLCWVVAVVGGLAFAIHIIPGFTPWVMYESVNFSQTSADYIIRYGLDKAIVGLLLIALLANRIKRVEEWQRTLCALPVIFVATLVPVMLLGVLSGYLIFDPKLNLLMLWWALGNLFITCIAEEAFFRLLIQERLKALFHQRPYAAAWVLGISAVLFGLAHAGGGWLMMIGGTIAGFGYAYAYHKTGRVEAAIVVHFALNATHIVFFSYPYAA